MVSPQVAKPTSYEPLERHTEVQLAGPPQETHVFHYVSVCFFAQHQQVQLSHFRLEMVTFGHENEQLSFENIKNQPRSLW